MSNLFKWTKDFLTGSKEEDNFDSLSYEELLKKSSEFDFENKKMEEKIKELKKENAFLNNVIIRKNNTKDSQYSNFLKLMEKNLLNMNNTLSNDYSISTFKNFLYNEKIFLGTLDEDDIKYLTKKDKDKEIDWEKEKEDYLLKQEILQKNLKDLYSNMFITKDNKKNKNIIIKNDNENEKKEEEINNKNNENKSNYEEKQKNKNISKENNYMNNYYNNFNGNKKEKESNILEEFLFNEDNYNEN